MIDYIKLPEGFFASNTMKGLRMEDNGTEATLIYLKLAARQGDTTCIVCDSIDTLAESVDEDLDTLEDAILTLADYGLVEAKDSGGHIYVAAINPEDVE